MKIQSRLIIFFSIFSLILLSVVGILFFVQAEDVIEKRIEAQFESIAVLKENQLNHLVEMGVRDLKELSEFHLATWENEEDSENLNLLEEKLLYTPLTEISIITLEGEVEISTNPEQMGKFRSEEEYFIEGLKSIFIQSFYYDISIQEQSMILSLPIVGLTGETSGVLIGRINIEEVSNLMLERSGLGKTGETFLVNKLNFVVTELKKEEGSILQKTIHGESIEDCLEGNNGFGYVSDYTGEEVAELYRWIPKREVCLLVEMDRTEIFESVKKLRDMIFLIGLFVLVLSSAITYVFSKSFSKPINKLSQNVDEISKGKLDIQLEKSSILEVQKLTDSLNRVLVSLKLAILRTGAGKEELGLGKAIEGKKKAEQNLEKSEKRFREIVNNAQEWIWEIDSRGMYIYSNSIIEKILGYKSADIVGKKYFYDFFLPIEKEELRKAAFKVFAGKQSFREFVNKNISKDGKIVWLSTSGVPILNTKGDLLGYRGADTDITKQEKLLRKHKLFFENANDLMQRISMKGKVVEVNKKWRETLGYSNEEALKLGLDQIISPANLSMCMKHFKKVIGGAKISNVKTGFLTKKGKEISVEINASPVFDDDGKVDSTIGIIRIIDEKSFGNKLSSQVLQKFTTKKKTSSPIFKSTTEKSPVVEKRVVSSEKVLEKKIVSKPVKKKPLITKEEKKYFLEKK